MANDVEDILSDLIARVGKVRRWLLALGVLRTVALWLACLSVYVGLYALIDHRVHFAWPGRLTALLGLIALLVALACSFVKTLGRDMTYSHAANHVESRQSFDQQLVAAVEYHEGRSDYPYSEALARQLVLHAHEATREYAFDATVEKWRGYLLAGCIVLCLSVVGLFVRQNVLYFSSYLARLIRPFSAIEPVPTALLESTTGDIVTGPNVPVTLQAEVQGRVPDAAMLVLTPLSATDPNGMSTRQPQRIEVQPQADGRGKSTLAATTSFDALGPLTYHFEAGEARSETHTITVAEPPAIESISATVTLPNADGEQAAPSRTEPVTGRRLDVLPGSRVALQIKTTVPIRQATVLGLDGQPKRQTLNDAETFDVEFTADKSSPMEFALVGSEGLSNREPQKLDIHLRSDEPPQFKLICPEADYLATNVASIPVTFEITDDFGLDSAQLCCELPYGQRLVLDVNAPEGARRARLSHTLELEQYDLDVGDSVLFYAQAGETGTGQNRSDAGYSSEVYFIEIRPYQQYWHPQPGGGPSSMPGPVSEDLITILEYTRAILKKTWALAHAPAAAETDRARLEGLAADVEYCAEQLAAIRDDPDYGFSERDTSALSDVIKFYHAAGAHLARHDATAALPSERTAYRLLRRFVDELHLKWNPPSSGQSVPQDKPERVTLQEQPEPSGAEKERAENQLEKMQQRIEKLSRQQESLKTDLADALAQRGRQGRDSPSDAASSSSGGSGPSSASASASQQQRDEEDSQLARSSESSGGKAQAASDSSSSDAAASASDPSESSSDGGPPDQQRQKGTSSQSASASGASGGQAQPGAADQSYASQSDGSSGQGQGRSDAGADADAPGESTAPGQGRALDGHSSSESGGSAESPSAQTDARLRMLEAIEKALRQQASDVSADLEQLALPDYSSHAEARNEAKERIGRAVEDMKTFEEALADMRYAPAPSAQRDSQTVALADSAARRLAEASRAIGRGLSSGQQQTGADQAKALARQLAADAEALDASVGAEERQQMLQRLKAAERLLEKMAGAQWATIDGGGAPGASHVYTRSPRMGPAETARMLAQQFWSIAIGARERPLRPVDDEPSDVEFFELENIFFESAATFRPQRSPK